MDNIEVLRLRFETMSYNDLRKAAKENNVKATGKVWFLYESSGLLYLSLDCILYHI